MDAPIATALVLCALCAGSFTGVAERYKNESSYERFLQSPDSYHLVDDVGNPVSQEVK